MCIVWYTCRRCRVELLFVHAFMSFMFMLALVLACMVLLFD